MEDEYGYGLPRYEAIPSRTDFPLMIISPSSDDRTNATFGGSADSLVTQIVEVNPSDAAIAEIITGDEVRIWNELGEVFFTAEVTDRVKQGVLYTPKGAWLATSRSGKTVNALMSADACTDIMSGACYNDTFVAIRKPRATKRVVQANVRDG